MRFLVQLKINNNIVMFKMEAKDEVEAFDRALDRAEKGAKVIRIAKLDK